MRKRTLMYLEEYARTLTAELQQDLEQAEREGDEDAAFEAKELEAKIADIRRIVAYLSCRPTFRD